MTVLAQRAASAALYWARKRNPGAVRGSVAGLSAADLDQVRAILRAGTLSGLSDNDLLASMADLAAKTAAVAKSGIVRHWARDADSVRKVLPVEGQVWDLSPSNPVPPGFYMDHGRRLRKLSAGSAGSQPSLSSAASSGGGGKVSAAADRLLAAAKAAGWSGAPLDASAWCGGCTPCRNGARSECIERGSRKANAAAAARAAESRAMLARVAPTLGEQIRDLERDVLGVIGI